MTEAVAARRRPASTSGRSSRAGQTSNLRRPRPAFTRLLQPCAPRPMAPAMPQGFGGSPGRGQGDIRWFTPGPPPFRDIRFT